MQLRDYQEAGCISVYSRLRETEPPRVMIAFPTGTGKSYVELALQRALGDRVAIVSPRCEILAGIAAKGGSEAWTPKALQALDLWTPIRLRNVLRRGKAPEYDAVIFDEGHHAVADSWKELEAVHYGLPLVALTATPYRGTPKGTKALRETWGRPIIGLTLREAVSRGVLAFPSIEVIPLLDDDKVRVTGAGEFEAESAASLLLDRLDDLAQAIAERRASDPRPTIVSVPSRSSAQDLLCRLSVPAVAVTEETPAEERREAFDAATKNEKVLVNISVVGEGIDLPKLRIWWDATPTLSPVRWLQALGRITRPGDTPRVFSVCRNVERHAYLLEGLLPSSRVAEAQQAFGGASARLGVRHLGLEALARFKAIPISLGNGCTAHGFALWAWEQEKKREYFALALPTDEHLLFARRVSVRREDGEMDWGGWEVSEPPYDLSGFSSTPKAWTISEKQANWWKREAAYRGLSSAVPSSSREFQVLPVLRDLGVRIER